MRWGFEIFMAVAFAVVFVLGVVVAIANALS